MFSKRRTPERYLIPSIRLERFSRKGIEREIELSILSRAEPSEGRLLTEKIFTKTEALTARIIKIIRAAANFFNQKPPFGKSQDFYMSSAVIRVRRTALSSTAKMLKRMPDFLFI